MDELLAYVVQLIDYIEANANKLNAETQRELIVFLQEVMQFINEYAQHPTQQPEMQAAMPSSNIYGFNYDHKNARLLVKFQGNDGVGGGPVYSYDGVPPYMFNLFRQGAAIAKTSGKNKWGKWWVGKSPSIGAAMDAFIKKGGYSYQRLS